MIYETNTFFIGFFIRFALVMRCMVWLRAIEGESIQWMDSRYRFEDLEAAAGIHTPTKIRYPVDIAWNPES